MDLDITARWRVAKAIFDYWWVKPLVVAWGILWALSGAYSLVLDQFVPPIWASSFPKVWQVVSGLINLPFWAWLLALAFIAVAASFEYAFRRAASPARYLPTPIAVASNGSNKGIAGSVDKQELVILKSKPKSFSELWQEQKAVDEAKKINYEKLFKTNGDIVMLRFPPYSNDPIPASLLLALLGYSELLGVDKVREGRATHTMYSSGVRPVMEKINALAILYRPNALDIVRDYLSNDVDVSGLADGGFLSLSEQGRARAELLAEETINRA